MSATYLDRAGMTLLLDLGRCLRTRRQRLGVVVPAEAPMRRVLELYRVEEVAALQPTFAGALDELGEVASG